MNMKKGGYTINDIYQGGYSSLEPYPSLSPINYPVHAGSFGLTTDPRNANVLKEISTKLSTGVKQIELAGVSPEIFESIPQRDLKEINRLSKLTGVDVSVHGPIIEASGISQQGFTESGRKAVERQMNMAVERAHEINPDGSSPVTFHSSAVIPGEIKEKGKKEVEETLVINTETGSINKIPIRKMEFPKEPEASVENQIMNQNKESWTQNISHINYYAELGGEAIERSGMVKELSDREKEAGKEWTKSERQLRTMYNRGASYLEESYRGIRGLFDIAYRKGTNEDKKILKDFYKEITPDVETIQKNADTLETIEAMKEIVQRGTEVLGRIGRTSPPQIIEPLNEFAKKRTTDTFANVAWNSYDKFKDKAPIISIENPPAGAAFSTAEELREVVEESRNKFVEIAVKEGMSESEARKQAEKLLGVTWDVGHINMLRKYGYEEKEIIEAAEKIRPLVKHVHLSDNFGFEHTELPMGMGNVPIKEIMEKLGKEGYDAKKIIEAASWWQHFQTPPVQETLQAFGSPIYSMEMAPSWNQIQGFQQDYYSGMGPVFPGINYQTFGTGFAQLPMELGGQMPGAEGARMSGKPME